MMGGDFHAARCVPTFIEITERTEIGKNSVNTDWDVRIIMLIFAENKSKRYMPKIFEYFGFIFYFYSNEHEPIHVHVMHGGKESVFDLIMMDGELSEVRVREKKGAEPLPEKDKRTAEEFIHKYYKNIIDKWVKFFVLKQAIRSTNIKKKI